MAPMLQASDRDDFGARIENAGKCALEETGKHPVNGNDEEEFAVVSIRDGSQMRAASSGFFTVIARSESDDPSTLAAQATPGWESAEARRAKAEAIQLRCSEGSWIASLRSQ